MTSEIRNHALGSIGSVSLPDDLEKIKGLIQKVEELYIRARVDARQQKRILRLDPRQTPEFQFLTPVPQELVRQNYERAKQFVKKAEEYLKAGQPLFIALEELSQKGEEEMKQSLTRLNELSCSAMKCIRISTRAIERTCR